MADQKVSDLPALNGADVDAADLLYIVDSSAGSAGSKKITVGQYQLAPVSGGTANGVVYLNGSKVVTTGSAMTLDASGNLLVGTTATGAAGIGISNGANLTFTEGSGASYVNLFRQSNSAATVLANGYKYTTTANGFASSTGNLWAKSAVVLDAGSVIFYANGATTVANGTDVTPTECARITSGGDLLVGTTNASVGTAVGCRIVDSGARLEVAKAGSTNSDIGLSQYSTGAAAYRFYVGYGGTVYATNTTITAISDQRLKENIRDLDVGLDKIMALKPRKFDWKAGKGKDKKGDRGWIAQEFEQVFPDMVDTWQDPAPKGEEPYKAVNADLIPVLVKAIQEQQALITDLRARVAALESA